MGVFSCIMWLVPHSVKVKLIGFGFDLFHVALCLYAFMGTVLDLECKSPNLDEVAHKFASRDRYDVFLELGRFYNFFKPNENVINPALWAYIQASIGAHHGVEVHFHLFIRQVYYLKDALIRGDFKTMREIYRKDAANFYQLSKDVPEYAVWNKSMNEVAGRDIPLAVKLMDFPEGGTILDIAGNHGENVVQYYKPQFTHRNLKWTILDLEAKRENALKYLAEHGAPEDVTFVAGDAFQLGATVTAKYDAVVVSHFLEMWGMDEVGELFKSIKEVLKPGGKVYVVDLMYEGKPFPAEESVMFALFTTFFYASTMGGGRVPKVADRRKLLESCGYTVGKIQRLQPLFWFWELSVRP